MGGRRNVQSQRRSECAARSFFGARTFLINWRLRSVVAGGSSSEGRGAPSSTCRTVCDWLLGVLCIKYPPCRACPVGPAAVPQPGREDDRGARADLQEQRRKMATTCPRCCRCLLRAAASSATASAIPAASVSTAAAAASAAAAGRAGRLLNAVDPGRVAIIGVSSLRGASRWGLLWVQMVQRVKKRDRQMAGD